MSGPDPFPLDGGCDCGQLRYRMRTRPLFVHCCHCRWCQRESGAAFALNAMIEADRVQLLGGEPELVDTPSASGQGQKIARCPRCRIAVWSNYAGAGPLVRFVRVGTLDQPDHLGPDIHIFTASKQPWVVLPPGTPAVAEYYDSKQHWPADSLERRRALLPRIEAWKASRRQDGGLPAAGLTEAPAGPSRHGAINHLDLTVSDLPRSVAFYDRVLGHLGYQRSGEYGGPVPNWVRPGPGPVLGIGLHAARTPGPHDRYSPGLHHLAFHVDRREDVDAAHRLVVEMGAQVLDAPAEYDYTPGYYAVFFADPDGLKLEVVHEPRLDPS